MDVYIKVDTLMIAILDYSKIGTEVLEVGIENPNFGKSRGVLKTNKVANSVLATTHGNGVQSSCTFEQKVDLVFYFIFLFLFSF